MLLREYVSMRRDKDVTIKCLRNWDGIEEGTLKEMEDRGNNKIK